MATIWERVLAALAAAGWTARVVPAERMASVEGRVRAVFESGQLSDVAVARLAGDVAFSLPGDLGSPRAVVVGAVSRPLTRATLTIDGEQVTVIIPPHYAGYASVPDRLADIVAAELRATGNLAARIDPPLKTLAAGAGLARYGRNNLAYVPGLGSYLLLAACVSDAPPPEGSVWQEPQALERCEQCSACVRACPTGAIPEDRFLLETERCLTFVNEDPAPFPTWVHPSWHACAIGCLRCQRACPENARVKLREEPPEVFDAGETSAILAGADGSILEESTRRKLGACGLDYSSELIARNLSALLSAR